MSDNKETKKILISGAGLVGCLLAISLKKHGHEVLIAESREDFREFGASAGKSINLILTAKGIKPLKKLGILDSILAITTPVLGRMIHSIEGELSYQPYGKDDSEKNYSISRYELNCLLIQIATKAGVQIKFNTSIENIDFDKHTAYSSDGAVEEFEKMFGADGAGSITRKILNEKYSIDSSVTSLEVRYKELFMPALASNNYAMEKTALHIWPRGEHMLMALPNRDGSFTMTVYMPTFWFDKLSSELEIKKYFNEYYQDALNLMPNCISHFKERESGFLGSLETPKWIFENTYCLVGDAAHAIVPFFGQGMNCGFSDVSFLLSEFEKSDFTWESCFENYQLQQKPAGDAIRDMSIENYTEMSSSVGDAKFLFRKKIERLIENQYPEKFRSRYAKVVYTDMPYNEAKAYGQWQAEILDQVLEGINDEKEIDWELVKSLLSTT